MRCQAHLRGQLHCRSWIPVEVAQDDGLHAWMPSSGLVDEEFQFLVSVVLLRLLRIVSDDDDGRVLHVYERRHSPAGPELLEQRRDAVSAHLDEEHDSFASLLPRRRLEHSDAPRQRRVPPVAPGLSDGHDIVRASHDMVEERVSPVLVPDAVGIEGHG